VITGVLDAVDVLQALFVDVSRDPVSPGHQQLHVVVDVVADDPVYHLQFLGFRFEFLLAALLLGDLSGDELD